MKSAEQYILTQQEPYKSILLHLQLLIETTFKEAELVYKWKIPFYYLTNKPLCYLNVSTKKRYVDVGFYSRQVSKYETHLMSEGRKLVKSLRYFSVEEINEQILITVLTEIALSEPSL